MPKYHFDLVDGHEILDFGGQECRDDIEAKRVADLLAQRLAENWQGPRPESGYAVRVVYDGDEIYRIALKRHKLIH
jgi:hypothetical protein